MTRGERNFNPGNLERNAEKWRGMARDQLDERFITFVSPEMGIRALARTLLNYQRKHGLSTVRGIIDRWAPPNENNTDAYVESVCKAVGMSPMDGFNFDDPDYGRQFLEQFVKAIIVHENGRCIYSDEQISDGVALALEIRTIAK